LNKRTTLGTSIGNEAKGFSAASQRKSTTTLPTLVVVANCTDLVDVNVRKSGRPNGWKLTGEAAHDTEGREWSMRNLALAAQGKDREGLWKGEKEARGTHTEGEGEELALWDARMQREAEGRRENWSAIASTMWNAL